MVSNLIMRCVFLSLLLVTPSIGEEKTLTAAEIKQLLSGNTAIGHWVDHNYRQYFSPDGSTIYAQENARSSTGRWRVNSSTNQYESWWERAGWGAGYSILLKEGVFYWISSAGSTEPQSFEMVPGSQLVAKE